MSRTGKLAATTYTEPARTYTNVYLVVLAFGVGFAIDASLGGAVAHLPGWLIALVLVVGVDVLIVHSARATRSLALTDAELRVGDEAVPRADITSASSGYDRTSDAPVLGWPSGMPRLVGGVTIRVVDRGEVVVPTRFPDRLVAALGVATVSAAADLIRPADDADLDVLADVDERASTLFRLAGYDLPPDEHAGDEFDDAVAIFVYDDPPVGYVHVEELDGSAHVQELAVIPKMMRKGVGTALLEFACDWARSQGYPAVTLTTFADVAWNAPFYAARGFVEADRLTPDLAARRERERAAGLDDVARRIVMRREL